MALVPCKSCGELISDQAAVCPKCGYAYSSQTTSSMSGADMFIIAHGKEFPESQLPMIRERLMGADNNKLAQLNMLQYKNPTTLLIVSIFLGCYGVDRFILGDTGLGVAKLLTCGGCGIWTIIDWFSVSERTRQWNFQKLLPFL